MNAASGSRAGWAGFRAAMAAGAVLVLCCAGLAMTTPAAQAASPAPAASPPPRALPGDNPLYSPPANIQTRVVTNEPAEPGNQYQVKIDANTTYYYDPPPAEPVGWACPTGVWVLALDRAHLDPGKTITAAYPLCSNADAAALGQALTSLGSSYIVIVNSLNYGGGGPLALSGLGNALASIGAVAPEFGFDLATTGFSVLGVPGLPQGQAYQVGEQLLSENGLAAGTPAAASINGTLVYGQQRNDNGVASANYTLMLRDYAIYDIGADGAITLNGRSYPVPAHTRPGYLGGFRVLVADRRTLGVLDDQLFETNGADALSEQMHPARDGRRRDLRPGRRLGRRARPRGGGVG